MMRKDLNYLNTNCGVYDMHFTETEFTNQTRDKLNLSRMLFQLFLMYQIHLMHPLKSKRNVLTDRIAIQETGPFININGENWYYKIN